MKFYRAFGLGIHSELDLNEFEQVDTIACDLLIRLHEPAQLNDQDFDGDAHPDKHVVYFPGLCAYIITALDRIDVYPEAGKFIGLLSQGIAGPVMATLLHLRGQLVLHACSVNVNGYGIVVAGDKGAGKSTTSAALIQAGHDLLADDVVTMIQDGKAAPQLVPAFPQVKLCLDAAAAISFADYDVMPLPFPEFQKELRRLNKQYKNTNQALDCVFVLERSTTECLTIQRGMAAVSDLMRYTYLPRRKDFRWTPEGRKQLFEQCALAAQTSQVVRLGVPRDIMQLPALVRRIEDHLTTLTPRGNLDG